MTWFKPNRDQELKNLLKNSSQEFRFDPKKVKYRLMSSIASLDQKPVKHFQFTRVIKYSVSFAGFVIVLSSTFAFASNARPGDKLFALNKAGEQVILSLPLPAEQKARVQEYIVTQRFEALDRVQEKSEKTNIASEAKKLQTVKESNDSLNSAVEQLTKTKKQLESQGKTEKAEKLEAVLDKLQTQAEKQEKAIQNLENETENKETKLKFENHLQQLKSSRKKAQSEIKRYRDQDRTKETDDKRKDTND